MELFLSKLMFIEHLFISCWHYTTHFEPCQQLKKRIIIRSSPVVDLEYCQVCLCSDGSLLILSRVRVLV